MFSRPKRNTFLENVLGILTAVISGNWEGWLEKMGFLSPSFMQVLIGIILLLHRIWSKNCDQGRICVCGSCREPPVTKSKVDVTDVW